MTASVVPTVDVFRALIDSPQNLVIFALDLKYRYLAFNEAHRQVMKQIWNVDIYVGQNMLTDVVGRDDDRAKAKIQFDRALSGEHFVIVDDYGDDNFSRRSYENRYGPLKGPDGSILGLSCFLSDVTEQRQTQEALVQFKADLAVRAEENAVLVDRLRQAVQELSTPVLEVWDGVLVLPVVGIVDTERGAEMEERLLTELVKHKSRFVIVDLTGVNTLDTSTADRFVKLARSVSLLGSRCIMTGIQPAVAQTLVGIGVEFGGMVTQRNLKQGLDFCIRQLRNETSLGNSSSL
jgi:anti-anti-sigma regulatory factor